MGLGLANTLCYEINLVMPGQDGEAPALKPLLPVCHFTSLYEPKKISWVRQHPVHPCFLRHWRNRWVEIADIHGN